MRTAVVLVAEFLFRKKTQSISELKCPIPRGSSSALVEVIVTVLYGVVNIEQMNSTSVLSIYVLGKGNIKHTEVSLTILMHKSLKGLQKGKRG